MKTLAQFIPHDDLDGKDSWLVVLSRHRDSGHAANSNFDAAFERIRKIDPEGEHSDTYGGGHFAVGWVEAVIVKPDSPAHDEAVKILEKLESYPLLDEDDVSRREQDEYIGNMYSYGLHDFASELVKKFKLSEATSDLLSEADKDKFIEFFESLNDVGDFHDEGVPNVSRSVRKCTKDDMKEFLRIVRADAADDKSMYEAVAAYPEILRNSTWDGTDKSCMRIERHIRNHVPRDDPDRLRVEQAIAEARSPKTTAATVAPENQYSGPRM